MTKILVTGGAGYIGSHTCKALAHAGLEPIVYDNLIHGHEWAVKWGPLEKGDILDKTRLSDVIARHRPSAVIHFAAFGYVGESVVDPRNYYWNNVVGSLTVLEVMREHRIDRIVFSSSCATYGNPDVLPVSENARQIPTNPYGSSKLVIERVLADYEQAYNLRSVSLRYFNAAGADPQGELGECHVPETHLIPLVLDVAAGKRPPLTIFGSDYDTPDGTCIRDYVHVSDLARAHVLALQRLSSPRLERAYNLGTGRGYSVRDVINVAMAVTGRHIPIIEGPRRQGDPAKLLADPAQARRDLDWVPHFAGIEDMIESGWRWCIGSRP